MQNQMSLQQTVHDVSQMQNMQQRLPPDFVQSSDQYVGSRVLLDSQSQQLFPPNHMELSKEPMPLMDQIGCQPSSSALINEVDGNNVLAAHEMSRMTCYKCGEKGHGIKDCPNKVICNVCGKHSHISSKCAWLRQPKPVAKFVCYAAAGLGCFVVEHARDLILEEKNNSIALVTVVSGSLNASQLAHDFELNFPWKWEWVSRENDPGSFLLGFLVLQESERFHLFHQ